MIGSFDEWVASLRLDEPDEGGSVGVAPAGRLDFFREVFEANHGRVSDEALSAAWRARELALVTRAAALVEADIRRTTRLRPLIHVETVLEGLIAVTYNGSYKTPATFALREPESICDVADNLCEHVVDDLWTVWPVCPCDGLGLDARPVAGRAVWHCRVGGHEAGEIGRLATNS